MPPPRSITITLINGSPKSHGNTAQLLAWVREGCEYAAGQAGVTLEVHMIHITAHTIQYCRGCHACLRTGTCPIPDDVADLLVLLENSQGIVVGSPVYEGSPTAQLKTFMDRIALRRLYFGMLETAYCIGLASSGIAPTDFTARECANAFGLALGTLGVHTATLTGRFLPLTNTMYPKVRSRAHRLGHRLIHRILTHREGSRPFFVRWIHFLRTHVLVRLITRNPEEFAACFPVWRQNGWLR